MQVALLLHHGDDDSSLIAIGTVNRCSDVKSVSRTADKDHGIEFNLLNVACRYLICLFHNALIFKL